MPISFYHGFEVVEPASRGVYSEQVQRILLYLDMLEQGDAGNDPNGQHVALRIETKLRRTKDSAAMGFRTTNDPNAPIVNLREEDVRESYPLTYDELVKLLRDRYTNFKKDQNFNELLNKLKSDSRYTFIRTLDSRNPKSARKPFFNSNIFQEFDRYYTRKGAASRNQPLTEESPAIFLASVD